MGHSCPKYLDVILGFNVVSVRSEIKGDTRLSDMTLISLYYFFKMKIEREAMKNENKLEILLFKTLERLRILVRINYIGG